ncbi:mRNA-binding protein nab2 [Tilletia horrida]|nr:mRNA-binding protein nab2 [Tilletia horrida]
MVRTRREVIHAELVRRGYCDEDDHVFAEFIDLMYGNKKTREAIDGELSELIGSDYDSSFTEWLWRKAEALAAGIDEDDDATAVATVQQQAGAASGSGAAVPERAYPEQSSSSRAPHAARRESADDERDRRISPHTGGGGAGRSAAPGSGTPTMLRGDSYRPARAEPAHAPGARRSGAPRELFASALNQAQRSTSGSGGASLKRLRSPSPMHAVDDHAGRSHKRPAMDDPSLQGGGGFAAPDFGNGREGGPKQMRIRGIGAAAAAAAAAAASSTSAGPAQGNPDKPIPTGPRQRGAMELFPTKMEPAVSAPPTPDRATPNSAASIPARPFQPTPNIFQRASMPDPRASAFVPRVKASFSQQQHADGARANMMQLDSPLPRSPAPVATPHYNPLFFGGGGGAGGTSAPLTQPPLAARLDPMIPDNSALPGSSTTSSLSLPPRPTNDISEFPTAPLEVSLCKYDLKCTNPMCRYSHATPSAANSESEADALVLKQDACPFGPRCAKKDCVLSHPSPAVAVAFSKAGMLASLGGPNGAGAMRATATALPTLLTSTSLPTGTAPMFSMTPGQVRCRWQSSCKNVACPFQHLDEAGNVVPAPASAAATSSDSAMTTTTTTMAADGRPAALDRALDDVLMSNGSGSGAGAGGASGGAGGAGVGAQAGKRCKWGADCRRADCMFGHPPTRRLPGGGSSSAFGGGSMAGDAGSAFSFSTVGSSGAMPCRYGASCFRADCFYSHPSGRNMSSTFGSNSGGGGGGMVNRMAQFALPADTKMETIIPKMSST